MYEYACKEGNVGMHDIIKAARLAEMEAARKRSAGH